MSPQSASAVLIEEPLRVLIASEEADHLPVIARVVTGLGHVIVAAEIDPDDIGGATRRELADVALVGLG
jgi:hypothetical protein